jgi:hypothetical protein
MILLLTLLFPAVLLLLMLAMERVEGPLRDEAVGDHLREFFDTARPDEVETFVSQGLARALERYWGRRRLRSRLVGLTSRARLTE